MLDAQQVIWSFPPWTGQAEPDSYRDWLGVRTRMRYLPSPYQELAGTVQGEPGADRAGLHDVAEWAGVLLAVKDANGSFVCAELGAGYGPFVVGSAVTAQKRGIADIKLIAVEGDETHFGWMQEHFRDNGLDPRAHKLLCGVVGTYDGTAQFPLLDDPATEWGGEPIFSRRPSLLSRWLSDNRAKRQPHRTPQRTLDKFACRPCYSLATILRDVETVDVVHFDIQGAEADVIASGLDVLNAKARRLVIGTHGRDIEQRLFTMLDDVDWTLEIDRACSFQQSTQHAITLLCDGVQVWRNPALSSDS